MASHLSKISFLARLKALEEYTMRKAAALKILALKKPIAALGVKELKALVHYKKRKCDGAVPTSNKDLVATSDSPKIGRASL